MSGDFMGWVDNEKKKPVKAKLEDAAQAYFNKHGRKPSLCLVSAEVLTELGEQFRTSLGLLTLRSGTYVRPGYFLVGEERAEGGRDVN